MEQQIMEISEHDIKIEDIKVEDDWSFEWVPALELKSQLQDYKPWSPERSSQN